ncbi:MAG: hypothetical protein IT340_20060 [Chloroflexi bacterium]|nr:hypothetical protein [Chloroflexota bacterium]
MDEDEALAEDTSAAGDGAASPPEQRRSLAYRQAVAFGDYALLPLVSGKRSLQALYDDYIRRHRLGEYVPTTNRSTLYDWRKQFDWDGQLAEREAALNKATAAVAHEARLHQYNRLWSMTDTANQTLHELMTDARDETVRLRASLAVLDRVGFTPVSRLVAERERLDGDAQMGRPTPDSDAPPENGSAAEQAAWLARQLEAGTL